MLALALPPVFQAPATLKRKADTDAADTADAPPAKKLAAAPGSPASAGSDSGAEAHCAAPGQLRLVLPASGRATPPGLSILSHAAAAQLGSAASRGPVPVPVSLVPPSTAGAGGAQAGREAPKVWLALPVRAGATLPGKGSSSSSSVGGPSGTCLASAGVVVQRKFGAEGARRIHARCAASGKQKLVTLPSGATLGDLQALVAGRVLASRAAAGAGAAPSPPFPPHAVLSTPEGDAIEDDADVAQLRDSDTVVVRVSGTAPLA
eukprot:TRINITY_DN2206_c0_g2_i1.p2 TRINITY_DN2206_c0_g2~~TRINITY_DN2206_c0_g2_i1.p2  ORF type:complete len:271 (-),score=69.17 TRINITY_DN2206_c0_g2_i1:104-892(-)